VATYFRLGKGSRRGSPSGRGKGNNPDSAGSNPVRVTQVSVKGIGIPRCTLVLCVTINYDI
jgi:hypothetical protein